MEGDMRPYFETLEEHPETLDELLALWRKRDATNLPGCPCRWGYHQLELCIQELQEVRTREYE